jgi:hypothetical protein
MLSTWMIHSPLRRNNPVQQLPIPTWSLASGIWMYVRQLVKAVCCDQITGLGNPRWSEISRALSFKRMSALGAGVTQSCSEPCPAMTKSSNWLANQRLLLQNPRWPLRYRLANVSHLMLFQYIDPIIAATWSEDGAIHDVCKALAPRIREPNTIVRFIELSIVHYFNLSYRSCSKPWLYFTRWYEMALQTTYCHIYRLQKFYGCEISRLEIGKVS